MKRKILSLIAGTVLCVPALSLAVGLGSVRTYSNLNERLNAEIPVLSVRQKGRMSVSLASNAEFAKRGVQRSDVLDDLQFSVVERNGRTYVKVRSGRQISAPYLSFILQLHTKEGIVSREYAIFLDPASGKKRMASAVKKKSVATSKPKQQAPTYKKPVRKAQPKPTVSRSSLPIANAKGSRYGPVREGETLWSIAAYSRPSTAVSVSDMVKAIRYANPRTLANGLQKGTSLYIPTIQGYSAFSGGYAPMPRTVKNILPATNQTKQAAPAKSANKKTAKPAVKKPLEKQVYGNNKLAENVKPAEEKKNTQVESDKAKKTAKPLATADVTSKKINKPVLKVEEAAKETISDVVKQAEDTLKAVSTDAKELADDAKNTVAENTEKTVDSVKEAANSAAEKLVKPVEKVAKEVVEKTEAAKQTAANTTEKVEEKAKEVVKAVTKPVEKAKKKVAVKPKPTIPAESERSVGFMGFVNDNLPLLGGGAAVIAGLGGAFYLRRKRQGVEGGTKDVVLFDDEENLSEGDAELTDSTFDDLAATTLLEELSEEEQLAAIEANDEVGDLSDTDDSLKNLELSFEEELAALDSEVDGALDELSDDVVPFTDEEPVAFEFDDTLLDDAAYSDLPDLEAPALVEGIEQVNDTFSDEQQLDDLLSDLDTNFDESELDLLEQAESSAIKESGDILPSLSELSDEANQFEGDDLNVLAATNEVSVADDIELVDENVNAPQPIPKMGDLSGFENNIEVLSDDDLLDLGDEVASVEENISAVDTMSAVAQEIDVEVLDEAIDLDDDFDFDEALQELDDEANNLADVDVNLDEGLTFDLTGGVDTKETVASSIASVSDSGADELIDIEAGDGLSLDFDLSDESETITASVAGQTAIAGLANSEAVSTDDLGLDGESMEADLVLNATTLSEEDVAKMQMKLDLASSFVSISQVDRAKDLLEEVIKEGNSEQAELATKVLNDIS